MGKRTVVVFDNENAHLIEDAVNFCENLNEAIQRANFASDCLPIQLRLKGKTVCTVAHCSESSSKVSLRVIDFNAHTIQE
jgi:hypothetical protein